MPAARFRHHKLGIICFAIQGDFARCSIEQCPLCSGFTVTRLPGRSGVDHKRYSGDLVLHGIMRMAQPHQIEVPDGATIQQFRRCVRIDVLIDIPRRAMTRQDSAAVDDKFKGMRQSAQLIELLCAELFDGTAQTGSVARIDMQQKCGIRSRRSQSIGLVPITGIPLPFISYGGSFVLSCCMLQGLVQSVWRFRRDFI